MNIAEEGQLVLWNGNEYIVGWSLHHLVVGIPKDKNEEIKYIKHGDYTILQ